VRNLWEPDAFVVSWRYPEDSSGPGFISGLDFVLDPLDDSCRLVFPCDTAFAFAFLASRDAVVVLRCDFKVEVSVDDIAELLVFPTD
jgi:RNA-dependent RNA polymerase